MKLRICCLLILFLLSGLLFAQTEDLTKWFEKANQVKTPKGVKVTLDPKQSSRAVFQPPEKTTSLYSNRVLTNENATSIFGAGAILYESSRFHFMQSIGSGAQGIFDEIREELQAQGVSDSTMSAYDQYVSCRLKAPFGTPWENWTEEQKSYWTDCGFGNLVFKLISSDLKANGDAYYLYWLGLDSTRLGVQIPYSLREEGMTVDQLKDEVADGLAGFGYAQNDPANKKVTREVAAAVRIIAESDTRLQGSGMALSELDAIADAALKIIDAATEQKLLQ